VPLRLGVLDFGDLDPVELAPHADELGYSRFWLAEHHEGYGHYADPLLMSMVIGGITRNVRVGPAGVLLRFHAPLAIAEGARCLESVYAGRVDLGLAVGTAADNYRDALLDGRPDSSRADLDRRTREVCSYLRDEAPIAAIPRHDGLTPVWVLGGSRASAELAGSLGAAFCASLIHRPTPPDRDVLEVYRAAFRPSREVPEPSCSILTAGACGTEVGATTIQVQVTFRGSPDACRDRLDELSDQYRTDEAIVVDLSGDLESRFASLANLARVCGLG
jgi:luciferase family oxidoreductase group 1